VGEEEMSTVRVRVDRDRPDLDALADAIAILRGGGVVAIPTETVYGLAACALDADAVGRIFAAKGRPPTNPLIVHVQGAEDARAIVAAFPEEAEALAECFWPGPLTLVLSRGARVPSIVTAGLETVAVRAPRHGVPRALMGAVGPLAAPSANRSNEISPTTADHVLTSLGGRIPMVLDAGPTDVGIESTVLSLVLDRPTILRPGAIGRRAIEDVVGPVDVAVSVHEEGARPSPGTSPRHYAPRAEVVLIPHGDQDGLEDALSMSRRTGALLHTLDTTRAHHLERLPNAPEPYARALYAALHALDARCDRIVVECVLDDEAWAAIADRLSRASR
jgi:L-threonylcarbamoyladenylate synthase